jgi:aspartate-semialdehyde dehydrogenase
MTNANYSTIAIVVPLHSLVRALMMYMTMPAISGARYSRVSETGIVGNVVPFIGGEEEKMEWETLKTPHNGSQDR